MSSTQPLIYVDLRGGNDGWGVVGDNLAAALEALTPICRLDDSVVSEEPLPGPLLERMHRFSRRFHATRHVAYCVFESDLRMRRVGGRAQGLFHVVVAASRWCEEALRGAGLHPVTTIHQGVDGTRFNPQRAVRERFRDRFVVFSGGKLELRKGQDVVVEAFRAFAERHADALLVAAWQQPWTRHAATMAASPYAPFSYSPRVSSDAALRRWLVDAGHDLRTVELIPPLPNAALAAIYGNTDVGLFPSRCEGATNLVMMEYMACGRPVIATDFSGHRDILTDLNSIRLTSWRPFVVWERGDPSACWCEPDIDEIVACLERAYADRRSAGQLGARAATDLAEWTWRRTAEQFLQLLLADSL